MGHLYCVPQIVSLHFAFVFLMCLVSDANGSPQPAIVEQNGLLGHGVYLPNLDFMSSVLPMDGSDLATYPLPEDCVVETRRDVTTKEEAFYRTTKQVYNSFTTETRVDGDLASDFALQASINGITNRLSSTDSQISGYSLKMYAKAFSRSIRKGCLNDFTFSEEFLRDFKNLPRVFVYSRKDTIWAQYRNFLAKYGSHIVRDVTYGASINQYSFAKFDRLYSQNDFKIKSCISLGRNTNTDTINTENMNACLGVSGGDITRVEALEMTDKIVIRGGTLSTRIALIIGNRTDDKIRKFLSEEFWEVLPIKYTFIELWTVLKLNFFGTPYYATAKTLEDYFKGKLNYGCDELRLNSYIVQKFDRAPGSSDDNPTYECQLMRRGCMNGDDCHYRIVPIKCSCHGPSCVEYRYVTKGDMSIRIIPYGYPSVREESGGCRYQLVPTECHCERGWQYNAVWQSINSY